MVHTVVRPGVPAREILAEARSRGNDLIVMSTDAPGPRSQSLLTSVAHWVLANSPALVLLVRPGGVRSTYLRTYLCLLMARPAGRWRSARQLRWPVPVEHRIVLVDVVVTVPAAAYAALPGVTLGGFIDPAWEQEVLTSARTYVENIAGRLRDTGLAAETHVALGDVLTEIIQSANAAGLRSESSVGAGITG